MADSNRRSDIYFLLVLLACSLAMNVYQRHQLRSLVTPTEHVPLIGTTIAGFPVADLQGNRSMLSFEGQHVPTVVYVFTPPCHWCARNWDNVRAIVHANPGNFRFIGLSLQTAGLRDYVTNSKIPFPVFTEIPPETKRLLQLGATPEMFVISPNGQLLNHWIGAFIDRNAASVTSYFNTALPGLSPDVATTTSLGAKTTHRRHL